MKICFVSTNYWPEPTGIAVYTTDLAEYFQQQGHEVSVLTGLPHYPWWKVPREYSIIGEGVEFRHGVEVYRAAHLVPKKMNAFLRMCFEISLWWNLRKISKKLIANNFEVVIAWIPTVAAGIVGKLIAHKQVGRAHV